MPSKQRKISLVAISCSESCSAYYTELNSKMEDLENQLLGVLAVASVFLQNWSSAEKRLQDCLVVMEDQIAVKKLSIRPDRTRIENN